MLISKRTPKLVWRITRRPPTPAPFIVGVSRSGTTLLWMMLGAHPDLAIPPETHFIKLAQTWKSVPRPADRFLEVLVSHRRWADFHLDAEVLQERIEGLRPFRIGDALRAFYELYAAKSSKPRWGDKTPGYLARMALIQDLLPEARFVHLVRDGRDVALSIKDLWFGPSSIEETAGWWRERIAQGRRQVKHLRYYLEVRYEDLVLQTEPTLKRVCEFVDLPWDPVMLEYHEGAGRRLAELGDAASGDSSRIIGSEARQDIHALTTRPPAASRVGRWRTEMTRSQREHFERVAGDTLEMLGYEVG